MSDLLERLRGVARFYTSSSNMSNTVLHVNTVENWELREYAIEAEELLELVDEVERLRAALVDIEYFGETVTASIARRALGKTE